MESTTGRIRDARSPEGQRVFNQSKGSLSPRRDVDTSTFPRFLRDQYDDFQRTRAMPGTITHALAVTPPQHIELTTAAATFLAERDPSSSTADFVAALLA